MSQRPATSPIQWRWGLRSWRRSPPSSYRRPICCGPRASRSLGSASSDTFYAGRPTRAAFLQRLKDTGFIEGNNISIEWRWAEGQYNRLPSLAAELVSRGVAVIVAWDAPAASAAKACLVGIEACASSHYWSRELHALGHNVRLMPPAYVKPYVKRQKNDMADAEAICEAVTRANMRFVPTKTPEQQSGLVLHRTRHLFIRQQTSVINAIRAHLAEFGVIAPVGRKGIEELLRVIADPSDKRVPDVVRACLAALGSQLLSLKKQILDFDRTRQRRSRVIRELLGCLLPYHRPPRRVHNRLVTDRQRATTADASRTLIPTQVD